MISVKHISLGGEETIHQARSLHYMPGDEPTLRLEAEERDVMLTGGTAFVMNDHGRTIARYDLGASMVPKGKSSISSIAQALASGAARRT